MKTYAPKERYSDAVAVDPNFLVNQTILYALSPLNCFHLPFYPVLGTSWAGLGMTPESHPGHVTRVTGNIVWAHPITPFRCNTTTIGPSLSVYKILQQHNPK